MAGIEPKTKILSVTETDDQLANTYDLTMTLEELEKIARKEDFSDGFMIVVPDPVDPGAIQSRTYNYLKEFQDMTEDMVKNSVWFLRHYKQQYDLEGLDWGQDFLENCSE